MISELNRQRKGYTFYKRFHEKAIQSNQNLLSVSYLHMDMEVVHLQCNRQKGSGDVMEIENNRLNNRHSAINDTGSPIIMLLFAHRISISELGIQEHASTLWRFIADVLLQQYTRRFFSSSSRGRQLDRKVHHRWIILKVLLRTLVSIMIL